MKIDRRTVLTSSLAAVGLAGRAVHSEGPDKPLRVGLIGSGWYGKVDLLRLIQVAPGEVVSLCDVDRSMLERAGEIVAGRQSSKRTPRLFDHYEAMLEKESHDVVLIATPDHWHALPMIAAVEAGADVYVQKPISVDVREGKAMLDAARRTKRVVQVGTQRRSTHHLREARESIIQAGKLGKVGLAEIYCYYHMRRQVKPMRVAVPEGLDWNRWIGPAPFRPYHPMIHPRGWRSFKEFGNGILGDMCIHMLDLVRWCFDLGWPRRVHSTGGTLVQTESLANVPDTQTATFEFDRFPVVWQHRTWGRAADPKYPWGATIYGDEGTLKMSVHGYDFIPRKGKPIHRDVLMELDKYPEDRTEKDLERHVAPAVREHFRDLLRARVDRGRPVADIEQGHISTASCILANLSLELGRSITWDAERHEVVGDVEANRRLARPYRAPYRHPAS